MRGMPFVLIVLLPLLAGCVVTPPPAATPPPSPIPAALPQTAPTQAPVTAAPTQPPVVIAPAPGPSAPLPAPPPVPTTANATAPIKGPTPAKAPAPSAQPPKTESATSDAAKPKAPPLNLTSLQQRLKDTKAIGVLTKLSLKNQVDDLLDRFRGYYQGKLKITLAELKRSYELLVQKVLALLQDSDPPLATAIVGSRDEIWGILSDPKKFATI